MRPGVAFLGAALLSGCYNFVPVERPAPGSTVRIHVPLRSAVQNPNARVETLAVEGVVLADGDSLILETENRREFGPFRTILEVDTLRVARSGIEAVEEQVFSRPKTYGMAVVVVAGTTGLLAAVARVAGGKRGDGGPDTGGPGAQIRVNPIFQALLRAIGR